ncbi:MAG TPA: B12-binding domain-containing protein [Capillimicrobium sp.]|nr:B12-binding domain-containing protein [Capillimicrobium sp.]
MIAGERPPASTAAGGASPAALAAELLDALLAGDTARAELIALDAVGGRLSLTDLYVDVITPALHEIGERWQRGELSVADEHLATGIVEDVMARVGRSGTRLPRRSRERLLLAGAENEGHVVGLRMLADLAEGAGFDVRYLGAAVPADALADLTRRLEPRIVCLTASVGAPSAAVVEAVEAVLEIEDVDVLLGGTGVPLTLQGRMRVHHAADVREAMRLIEELVA